MDTQLSLLRKDRQEGRLQRGGFRPWRGRLDTYQLGQLRFHPTGFWLEDDLEAVVYCWRSKELFWTDVWAPPNQCPRLGPADPFLTSGTLLGHLKQYERILARRCGLRSRLDQVRALTEVPSEDRNSWLTGVWSSLLGEFDWAPAWLIPLPKWESPPRDRRSRGE